MQMVVLMKFAECGIFGAILIFLLSLLFISSISFADSAPPPPSQVTVHLVSNGTSENGIGQITYHCTAGSNNEAADQKIIPLNCSAGTCTNEPYYGSSQCVYFPAGYFSYDYGAQNRSSETFNATEIYQRYYEYRLDVRRPDFFSGAVFFCRRLGGALFGAA